MRGPCMCGGCASCGYFEAPEDCVVCGAALPEEAGASVLTCGKPECAAELERRRAEEVKADAESARAELESLAELAKAEAKP